MALGAGISPTARGCGASARSGAGARRGWPTGPSWTSRRCAGSSAASGARRISLLHVAKALGRTIDQLQAHGPARGGALAGAHGAAPGRGGGRLRGRRPPRRRRPAARQAAPGVRGRALAQPLPRRARGVAPGAPARLVRREARALARRGRGRGGQDHAARRRWRSSSPPTSGRGRARSWCAWRRWRRGSGARSAELLLRGMGQDKELLIEQARRGTLALLLDGLDEVPALRREQVRVSRAAAAAWPCPIVVTSRPQGCAARPASRWRRSTRSPTRRRRSSCAAGRSTPRRRPCRASRPTSGGTRCSSCSWRSCASAARARPGRRAATSSSSRSCRSSSRGCTGPRARRA